MKNVYKKLVYSIILAVVVSMAFGCATRQTFKSAEVSEDEMTAYLSDKPAPLKPYFIDLKEEMDRNAILNHMKIGLKAFEIGEMGIADTSFEIVRTDLNAIYANNETAAKARSLFYEEGMKKFRGEPYERAMAFYYNGLVFMKKGDFENARACFKSGILQDAFAEEKQNQCDFGLLIFLTALASRAAGDDDLSEDVLKELIKIRPKFNMDLNKNTLVIVETGKSPRKLADGPGHSELKFFRGKKFREKKVDISINNSDYHTMFPIEDIYFQASSRGGRPIDKILEGQAIFRQQSAKTGETLADFGSTVMMISPAFGNSGTVSAVGGAIGLLGVASMAAAQNARPHADVRYWNNLPDTVHVYMADLPVGEHTFTCRFKDKNGEVIDNLSREKQIEISDSVLSVIWMSSQER